MTEAGPQAAAPIGLYVHWPFCAQLCPYCDFNVVRDRGRSGAALASAIVADLETQAAAVEGRRLASIFFGGGTPSLMDPASAAEVVAAAKAAFEPAPDLEVTLEANPTDAETERFAAFRDAGVGRLSLGVQSLDDRALAFLGRNHDAAQARRAAEVARGVFERLSIDLIYALPGQSPAAWRAGLAEALALGPEHVSAYQLTIEPGTAFARAVGRGRWAPPDETLAADLFEATGETLGRAGFTAYEISNHARGEAARSRHNLQYWRGGDYLGVGPGAHGRLTLGEVRWASRAAAGVRDYQERVSRTGCGLEARNPLTRREVALERLLMGLRTLEGVALAELASLDLDPARIDALQDQRLIALAKGRIVATPSGRLLLDRITLDLAEGAREG